MHDPSSFAGDMVVNALLCYKSSIILRLHEKLHSSSIPRSENLTICITRILQLDATDHLNTQSIYQVS